jgi:hypothetical protein
MVDKQGRLTKPEVEMSILLTVVDPTEFYEVVSADAPDFVLKSSSDDSGFGIEVTELFDSEAIARIQRQPDYLTKLLTSDAKPHRREIRGVVMETPRPEARFLAIAERIKSKTASAAKYRADLRLTELIILDHYFANRYKDVTPSTSEFLTAEVRAALAGSPFNEVYIVWAEEAQLFVPLRQLLIFESFEMFIHALHDFDHPKLPDRELLAADLIPLFVATAPSMGIAVGYATINGVHTAVTPGSGLQFTDQGLTILDARHSVVAPTSEPPTTFMIPESLESFKVHLSNYCRDHRVVTRFEFPVSTPSFLLPVRSGPSETKF